MPPTNKDVKEKAEELAIKYELDRLKIVGSTKIIKTKQCSGCDLQSPDGLRIEVKGTAGKLKNKGFRLNSDDEIKFVKNGGTIYRIVDVFGKPILFTCSKDNLIISEKKWATLSVDATVKGKTI